MKTPNSVFQIVAFVLFGSLNFAPAWAVGKCHLKHTKDGKSERAGFDVVKVDQHGLNSKNLADHELLDDLLAWMERVPARIPTEPNPKWKGK